MMTATPINDEQISLSDGFDAMRSFLEAYWHRGGKESDDIAVLLGSLNRDDQSGSLPLDPALWDDWVEAVHEIKNRPKEMA